MRHFTLLSSSVIASLALAGMAQAATVKFETFKFKYIDDDGDPTTIYDTAELHYNIMVNGTQKIFGRKPYQGEDCKVCYKSTDCGPTYTFNDSGLFFSTKDPYPDTILVPISTENIAINAWANFYDYDVNFDSKTLSTNGLNLAYSSLQDAKNKLGCGKSFVSNTTYADVKMFVTIYPNNCDELPPPGIPLPKPP